MYCCTPNALYNHVGGGGGGGGSLLNLNILSTEKKNALLKKTQIIISHVCVCGVYAALKVSLPLFQRTDVCRERRCTSVVRRSRCCCDRGTLCFIIRVVGLLISSEDDAETRTSLFGNQSISVLCAAAVRALNKERFGRTNKRQTPPTC